MLISHRKKFIFTKTVKTASTSVESFFEPLCMHDGEWKQIQGRNEYVSDAGIIGYRGRDPGGKTWYNHMPSSQIKEQIGDEIWNSYFKFTIVRNPFDKLISAFYMFEKNKKWKGGEDQGLGGLVRKSLLFFKQRSNKYQANEILQFRNWVQSGGNVYDRDKYLIDGEVCIDYFIRYENLEEDVAQICKRLEIPFTRGSLENFNRMFRNRLIPIREFYDDQTSAVVQDRFALEFERFRYKIPA